MNDAASNKMFQPKYRDKWPTAVQALAHLEKCGERVSLLIADGLAPDDPRLVAAKREAKRASDDYSRAEKTDESMRFQAGLAPVKEEKCIGGLGRISFEGDHRCQCGMHFKPEFALNRRCPGCNRKVS